MRFIRDHSLSIALVIIYFALQTGHALVAKDAFSAGWWASVFSGHADDAFGAILLVIFTEFFIERGSSESKE